jgi:hypothetical protein
MEDSCIHNQFRVFLKASLTHFPHVDPYVQIQFVHRLYTMKNIVVSEHSFRVADDFDILWQTRDDYV